MLSSILYLIWNVLYWNLLRQYFLVKLIYFTLNSINVKYKIIKPSTTIYIWLNN